MTIELQFNSVVLQYEDIKKYYPELLPMINSSLPKRKYKRRKPRKQVKTVASLIDEILDNIQSE